MKTAVTKHPMIYACSWPCAWEHYPRRPVADAFLVSVFGQKEQQGIRRTLHRPAPSRTSDTLCRAIPPSQLRK